MIDPLVGQTLGQYEIHAQLGQGGMATVYRGYQPSLGRAVAIKVLPLEHAPDPTLPVRFRREAQLAAGLMHPNIVPVYDFGEWHDVLYIVMALIGGGTLRDRAAMPIPVQLIVHLIGQVADALGFAHAQGIFHRDVKPTNILLASSDWAMLGDFGIARALGESTRLTGQFGAIGRPAYMAPEQWLGGDIDGRADIYALGIVLYELLTGSVPFTATTAEGLMRQHLEMSVPSLASHRSVAPSAFEEVIQNALAKDSNHRFRHAAEFKEALIAAAGIGRNSDTRPNTRVVETGSPTTRPHLGSTYRIGQIGTSPQPQRAHSGVRGVHLALLAGLLVIAIFAAGMAGFLAAGGQAGWSLRSQPPTISSSDGEPGAQKPEATAPAPVIPPSVAAVPIPTATPTRIAATTVPPVTPPPPTERTVAQQPPPTRDTGPGQREAQIERRISDYFAALNARDYARAHGVCCTPSFRARYPLDSWQRNFSGVSDLRFATPLRYVNVGQQQTIVDVDYSFVNSSGSRRYFTLRWTFVPIGSDWQADEAVASPQ